MRPTCGVVVNIFKDEHLNQVLLGKRAKEPDKGKWACPGGKVELWERLEEAGSREVEEETGVKLFLKEEDFFWTLNAVFPEHYHYILCHAATIIPKDVVPFARDDLSEVRWFTRDEVCGLSSKSEASDRVKEGIRKARAHLLYTLKKIIVLIAYHGNTDRDKLVAEEIAVGSNWGNAEVIIKSMETVEEDHILMANAIIVCSPMHSEGLSSKVNIFIDMLQSSLNNQVLNEANSCKVGAAFFTEAQGFQKKNLALLQLVSALMLTGMPIVCCASRTTCPGLSPGFLVERKGKVTSQEKATARAFGEKIARTAKSLVL